MDSAELLEKVAKRERFLQQVLDFCQSVVLDHGRVIEWEQGSDWTKTRRLLENFCHFDVDWYCGGGNNIKVFLRHEAGSRSMVLDMDYWRDGTEECSVNLFSREYDWEDGFAFVMVHAEEILAEMQERQTIAEQEAEKARKAAEEADMLRKKAVRLGMGL